MRLRQLRGWLMRFLELFSRQQREQEFADELASHLQMHIDDNVRAGMSPEEARRMALLKLGGAAQTQELFREQRGVPMLETLWQDVRFGLRMLRKQPGFSWLALLTLALGIGANTAIFSVVNAVLLQPYPHLETDRWVYLWEHPKLEGLTQVGVSLPNYRDWREQNQSFTAMVLMQPWSFNLSGTGEPESLRAWVVTTNLFDALKLTPAAGRMLMEADNESTARPIVISHSLWQRRFASDPALPGKTILLNLVPHTVVGVAPPEFSFPPQSKTDVWVVFQQRAIASATERAGRGYSVAALLKPGASLTTAQADLDVIAARLAAQYPEDKGFGIGLTALRESVAGEFRQPLLTLLGALGMVLLLASVNIANLQLVRLTARRRELTMRLSLGATRGRLLRQMCTESLLLIGAAGALGVWLAPTGVRLLLRFVPPEEVPWLKVKTDFRVWLACAGATLLAALLAGLLPAWRASRVDLTRVLATTTTGGANVNRRWRTAFIVAQLALAAIPLAGAGLLMNSFVRLRQVSPGFQTDQRLTLSYTAPRARYNDAPRIAQLAERLRAELQQTPGVREAGMVQSLPFAPAAIWSQAVSRVLPQGNPADLPHVRYTVASSGYLEALGMSLKAGRTFTPADTHATAPVVVINESLAKHYFPNEDPVGKPLWIGHAQDLPGSAPRTVIGVIGDTLRDRLDLAPASAAWAPVLQQNFAEDVWRQLFLVVHTEIEPYAALAAIRQSIARVDAELALTNIQTMEDRLGESVWRQRFTVSVLTTFSLMALALAVLGVFGVITSLVNQRTPEIGVRIALGARPADILWLVLKEGLLAVLPGIALGIAGALALARFLTGLLYGVGTHDPLTFVGVTLLLVAVALLACWLPARRATKVDPLIALRHD